MDLAHIDLCNPQLFVPGVPHELFAELRRTAPVFWHEEEAGAGFWSVMRYHDLVAVNRDSHTFSSYKGGALMMDWDDEVLGQQRMMMLNMDPPMHTRYRRLVNKGFTPRMVHELEQAIVERARQLVGTAREKGEFDFVSDIAAELPLQVIAELMGVPQEDRYKVFDWSNRMVGSNDPEFLEAPELATAAAMELFMYADALTLERKANPHEDLVSLLAQAEIEGDQLSQLEIDMFFMLLAVAGNETTRNLLSHGMLALMENPDERRKLLERPELLDSAIEEMLRYASPVMHFRRTATRDTEIGGRRSQRATRSSSGTSPPTATRRCSTSRSVSTSPGRPTSMSPSGEAVRTSASGPTSPASRSASCSPEILSQLPELELAGDTQRLCSNFINGIKHLPVSVG